MILDYIIFILTVGLFLITVIAAAMYIIDLFERRER